MSGDPSGRTRGWIIRGLALGGLLLTAAFCRGPEGRMPPREFQKGMAFTGYSGSSYEGEGPLRSLEALVKTNATWISVLVTGYQESVHTTTIGFTGPETPSDASVERIIRRAHSLGLKVMLKPHVDLARDPAHYRGEIGPGFSAKDWEDWFASYRPFILHYAGLAARTGCEIFCVGCELGTTAVHASAWRGVIAAVRAIYRGPLIYADNRIEEDPEAVTWWDALDLIGQDAYPTLTAVEHPTVDDLLEGWKSFGEKLWRLSEKWGKPLVLTEIGCRSLRGGAQNPWDWQRRGPVDLDVQKNFYEAACRAVAEQPWLVGVYWWDWSPAAEDGGPNEAGYTARGKPAEDVLRAWYLRLD